MLTRVTNIGQNNNTINRLTLSQNKFLELQNQLMSGESVSKPSDDALNTGKILSLSRQLNDIVTYRRNISSAKGEIETTEGVLSELTDKLLRGKDLAILASNEINSEESLIAIKNEASEILETVKNFANTKYNGNYIFAGQNTQTLTYSTDNDGNITYQGTNTGDYKREVKISDTIEVTVNVDSEPIFGSYDANANSGDGALGTLGKFVAFLEEDPPNTEEIRKLIDKFETYSNESTKARTFLGTQAQMLDVQTSSFETNEVTLSEQKSNLTEVDLVSAISNLMSQQYALQASMQAASSIQMPSLLNYM
mgnify:FL=1